MPTGYLLAFAVMTALKRQAEEGGSWHVRLSLAQTGYWLRQLGRNRRHELSGSQIRRRARLPGGKLQAASAGSRPSATPPRCRKRPRIGRGQSVPARQPCARLAALAIICNGIALRGPYRWAT